MQNGRSRQIHSGELRLYVLSCVVARSVLSLRQNARWENVLEVEMLGGMNHVELRISQLSH